MMIRLVDRNADGVLWGWLVTGDGEVLDFTRRQAKRLAFIKWLYESQTKCADSSPIRPLE